MKTHLSLVLGLALSTAALSATAAPARARESRPDPRPTFAPNPQPSASSRPDPRPTFAPDPRPSQTSRPDPRPTFAPDPRPTQPSQPDPRPSHPDPRPTFSPNPRPTHIPDPRPTVIVPDPRPTVIVPDPRPTYIPVPSPQVSNYANQQARTVANRVAATYGALENWRFNFSDGFWQGYAESSALRSGADYSAGFNQGLSQGSASGDQAGRSAAASQAESLATPDVRARFAVIVDQAGREPDLTVSVPRVDYAGSAPQLPDADLATKMAQLDPMFQSELRALAFNTDAWVLRWSDVSLSWSLRDVYQYGGRGHYIFVDSWFREEFAWNEWNNNSLGGGYDYSLYRRLDSDQKDEFRRDFKQIYDEVIDEKFLRVRNQYNPIAFLRGVWYGQQVGSEMARQQGYNAGYEQSYRQAATRSFVATFDGEYTRAFQARASQYLNGAMPELGEMHLLGSGGSPVLLAGDRLTLEILHAANLGRRGLEAPVRLETDAREVHLVPFSGGISLAPSSSMRDPSLFANVGELDATMTADQPRSVTVVLGGVRQSIPVVVSFRAMAQAFAAADTRTADGHRLARYLVEDLRKEWKTCTSASGNCYKPDQAAQSNNKLWQLVQLFHGLDGQGQANVRGIADQLRRISDDGGFWHPIIRGAFQDLVSQLH